MTESSNTVYLTIRLSRYAHCSDRDDLSGILDCIAAAGGTTLSHAMPPELVEGDWFGDDLLLFSFPGKEIINRMLSSETFKKKAEILKSVSDLEILAL